MERRDGRRNDELRPVRISRGVMKHAEGSALVKMGDNRIICAASVEEGVPPHMEGTGAGWVTAEYSMLPRVTERRSRRYQNLGHVGGRALEIQRIIGRVLRACIDLGALGERTIIVDCDVLQADGGTRTASITGGFSSRSMTPWRRCLNRVSF